MTAILLPMRPDRRRSDSQCAPTCQGRARAWSVAHVTSTSRPARRSVRTGSVT